ncbi:MAG: response regulator [Acidobacteriia bacterium]|nr:response regulator [Terriglobia bacterium]
MSIGQIRVLVVEDDEVSVQIARSMLEKLGCQVDAATNGVEAIKLFRQEIYNLILMDWQMPHMDGFETTARIRSMPRGRVTPILGTTANMTRLECMAAGMNDVMPKPFLRKKLKLELSKWTHWDEKHENGLER